jgi:hypothetical protein
LATSPRIARDPFHNASAKPTLRRIAACRACVDPLADFEVTSAQRRRIEPEPNEYRPRARRCVHKSLEALGGLSSPAGSCVWHVVGLQRSVREWAIRQGWCGRPVRQEQAQGILVAALGMLAAHFGYAKTSRAS